MEGWVYFVLVAQAIWAFTSLIDKIVISKGYIRNPLVYIVLNGLMNIFLIFLLPFVGFEQLKFADFMVALFAGATWGIAVAIYYKAVQYDEISRIVIIGQLSPIFVLALSFALLGEVLTTNYLIGFLLLLISGLIVSYRGFGKRFKLSYAFNLMLASALIGSFSIVSAKHVFTVAGFWSAFLWLRLTSFIAASVLLVPSIRREFIGTFSVMPNKARGLLVFKMLIDFSAFIFAGYALTKGPVSLVSALSSAMLPLFVFALTLFTSFFIPNIVREGMSKSEIFAKAAAIAIVIIGIIFVNLG